MRNRNKEPGGSFAAGSGAGGREPSFWQNFVRGLFPMSMDKHLEPIARQAVLTWGDVKCSASIGFEGHGNHAMRWAQQAWEYVIGAGLANYASSIERCRCAVRFLGLLGIYEDFCQLAYGEPACLSYTDYPEPLNLDRFVIGQLAGPDNSWQTDASGSVSLIFPLKYLADQSRHEVYSALWKGFGNDQLLYLSLLASKRPDIFIEWPTDWRAVAENYPDWEKRLMPSSHQERDPLVWIMEGCEPYATLDRDP